MKDDSYFEERVDVDLNVFICHQWRSVALLKFSGMYTSYIKDGDMDPEPS